MITYAQIVVEQFLKEFENAKELKLSNDYNSYEPYLMQRRVPVLLKQYKYLLNYSKMGSGKTLSAIISSRYLDSNFTLILCPNQVVSTWKKQIKESFASFDIQSKTFLPSFKGHSPYKYLILNYEMFQQKDSTEKVLSFIKEYNVEFIVIDEIHLCKQRDLKKLSVRRKNVMSLRSGLQQKNKNLYCLTMSGTPVINNLIESKSIIELTTGIEEDIGTSITIPNIMRHYQRLSTIGVRYVPEFNNNLSISKIDIDVSNLKDEIKKVFGNKMSILELERLLTLGKIPTILNNIVKGEKVIIYNHYINGFESRIKDELTNALEAKGFSVSYWDGEDRSGYEKFVNGNSDVLLASPAVSTGVDGLQTVCSKLIINILPWTSAEYEQLMARINRAGQKNDVEIIIPISYIDGENGRWSYDEYKMELISFKSSISDGVIDGIIPSGEIITKEKAWQYLKEWINRIETKGINVIEKPIITPYDFSEDEPSDDSNKKEISRSNGNVEWFSTQQKWSKSNSKTLLEKYSNDNSEWLTYHKQREEFIKKWDTNPCNDISKWCLDHDDDLVIGDFGCGQASIADQIGNRHKVYSFDFVKYNNNVTQADSSDVPLEDRSLYIAVFSLSLITADCNKSLFEAHRTLKKNKFLYIVEPINKFDNIDLFIDSIESIGFSVWKQFDLGESPTFKHLIFIKDKPLNDSIDIVW